MTDDQLKAAVEKLRNSPWRPNAGGYVQGYIQEHASIILALYDRIERQQVVIQDLERRVIKPQPGHGPFTA